MKRMTAMVFLVGLTVLWASPGECQSDPSHGLLEIVVKKERARDAWAMDADRSVGLFVAITVLGLLGSTMPLIGRERVRAFLTVSIGILVGAFNVVNAEMFDPGHKALRGMIADADEILTKARTLLNEYPSDKPPGSPERKDFSAEWSKLMAAFDAIARKRPVPSRTASLHFVTPAYAGLVQDLERAPGWVEEPPTVKGVFHFVGVSRSTSLSAAQVDALEIARESGREYLRAVLRKAAQRTLDVDALARQLAQSAGVEDTFFTYSQEAELFSYYVLLRLPQAQIADELTLYSVSMDKPISDDVRRRIESVPAGSSYGQKRQLAYATALDDARKSLSEPQYAALLNAREARKTGNPSEAIALLEPLVNEKPGEYIAWFNLALAYSGIDDAVRARDAYVKAIALEPGLSVRDASVYYSYGNFLFKKGDVEEAIPYLNKALELDDSYRAASDRLKEAAGKKPHS